MSFITNDLSVLAYANNFTLWHYTSQDADITTSGYFDKASDMLRVGDLIIANVDTDGTPATNFYIVSAVASGSVSISAYA
ncbi:MAG: hypothetical protein CMH26_05460 [Micavibrio sp.]|nr:hypothetical protein [Micavibrio sp.]|tara:strand:+ start:128 stop:367 length:240 start_codon:yes stop_codon:yes gene_type:complete